jgi:cytochrome c5
MKISGQPNTRSFGLLLAILLARAILSAWIKPTLAAEPAAGAAPPSTVAAAGVTLRSVSVDFPDPGNTFPGAAEAVNNNCLACHSTGMVLTQPRLSRAEWQAEVDKMRNAYKAPIADADVPPIVDYLAKLNTGK